MIRVLLVGANGRMGQAVRAAAERDDSLTISGKIGRDDNVERSLESCDVVIDFSTADATEAVVRACQNARRPLVLGTTGQNAAQKQTVAAAARDIPIVFSANFSIGVNLLFALTRRAAQSLGQNFDRDVIELHHRTKRDAPSGTAKRLAEILQEVSPEKSVEPLSVRAGDIVGEHSVIFSGNGERLELTHRAGSRATFAEGALRAANWVVREKPGLYSMEDVLATTGQK